jgi:glycosyltransferase involved in cell wall biosynthesis
LSGLNYHEDPEFERRWLSSNYGQVVETVDDAHPVSDLVCNLASDVFVHSNFVRTRLRQLGLSHVHVVDLAYDLSALGLGPGGTRSKGDAVRIGIFGTFQKNRQIPLVIGALGLLRRHGVTGWKLVLGGRRSHDFDEILAAIEACGIGAHIELHEDVAGEDFISLIKNVDVHVALRNPTYGETSGVVVQGLASGVPTIVSDVGWYSELPDFVAKIPAMGGLLELAKTLRTFIVDPELRAQTGLRTQRFGSTAYDVRRTAEEILSILTHEKNI